MDMGPWAQGDLIRDVERAERARFRRVVKREFDRIENDKRVLLPDSEMLDMLDRIKAGIAPRKKTA